MRSVFLFFSVIGWLMPGGSLASIYKTKGSGTREKLKALAAKKVKAECASCKVTVQCKWLATAVKNAPPSTITALYFDKPGLPVGYVTAKVGFKNERPSPQAQVQLYVSIQQKVPVAAITIKRGTPVSRKQVTWQWRDISHLSRRPVADVGFFKRKTAARMIRKAHVFYPSDLVGAASIRPGDQLTMQYDESGVQIAINCIARQAKSVGQKIRLYSKETGQRYLAKIISKDEIIWVQTL